jgi:hypothetical protein
MQVGGAGTHVIADPQQQPGVIRAEVGVGAVEQKSSISLATARHIE